MIDGHTKLLALFGREISHSQSPAIHNQWAEERKIPTRYLCLPTETTDSFLTLVKSLMACRNFLGGNITVPFKTDALAIAGLRKDTRVTKIGAANTLYRYHSGTESTERLRQNEPEAKPDQWALANTDVDGILATVSLWLDRFPSPKVVVLGAGGAAAAAIYALSQERHLTDISVACRQPERAHPTCLRHAHTCMRLADLPQTVQTTLNKPILVINTLPLGHCGEPNPAAEELICRLLAPQPEISLFFDMIYLDTPAVQLARSKGIPAENGLAMLRTQAHHSFKLWTGG
jgi:shikimate dehydrogenase